MKLFIWYIRPGGKKKGERGIEREISQYGVITKKSGEGFSVYLDSPWTRERKESVSFARYEKPQYSYGRWFDKEAKMDDYLWHLVAQLLGREAITRVFED